MNSWRNLVPAPLAAPETRALKAARLRTMTGLFLVAALVVSFGALRALTGIFALAMFAGACAHHTGFRRKFASIRSPSRFATSLPYCNSTIDS